MTWPSLTWPPVSPQNVCCTPPSPRVRWRRCLCQEAAPSATTRPLWVPGVLSWCPVLVTCSCLCVAASASSPSYDKGICFLFVLVYYAQSPTKVYCHFFWFTSYVYSLVPFIYRVSVLPFPTHIPVLFTSCSHFLSCSHYPLFPFIFWLLPLSYPIPGPYYTVHHLWTVKYICVNCFGFMSRMNSRERRKEYYQCTVLVISMVTVLGTDLTNNKTKFHKLSTGSCFVVSVCHEWLQTDRRTNEEQTDIPTSPPSIAGDTVMKCWI